MSAQAGLPEAAQVPLDQIRTIRDAWPRTSIDHTRVGEFVTLYRDGGLHALPPLDVVVEGDHFVVADGWHRTTALRQLGATLALVTVLAADGDPWSQAYVHALKTAATAALPLTRAERRSAARRLLDSAPRPSDRQIARLVGLSPTTVGKIRALADGHGDEPDVDTDEGDRYLTAVSAADLARRLVVGVERLWSARGLGDLVLGDRTSKRLAVALREEHGDNAATWARRYATWFADCLSELERSRPTT